MSVETYRELSVILLLLVKYYKYIKLIIIKLSPGYLEDIDKISLIDIWYFLNIFLEMSFVTFYLANARKFLVPGPGSQDLSSVVFRGLIRTHVVVPGDGGHFRIAVHLALEVNIVPLLDVRGLQRGSDLQLQWWRIWENWNKILNTLSL